ncbi:MAG: isoprenylcysteine carboxylmethyltransferase family protein [Chloroflexi bacterium]|nr:isoprenylcysteine carboxylmethyltransferase family protein [Chloroflexota bacterium]
MTTGPYQWVRHPMYTALFAALIALSLVSANALIAGPYLLAIGWIYARIGKEETMMLGQFGDAYRAYMRRVGGVIPNFFRRNS